MDDRYRSLRDRTAASLFGGSGATAPAFREAIAHGNPPDDLAPLVAKIRTRAHTITDDDIDRLRDHYSDDQLFEIIVVAAFGAAEERLAAAHRALEEA
jgi:hypothetical protein